MNNLIANYPKAIQSDIATLYEQCGVLNVECCERICRSLTITIEELMMMLLPIASSFSNAPISSYQVGAVVKGLPKDQSGMANLYVGANLEFAQNALCYSVHAEQAAISNAFLNNEASITALAISAAPCGHCRQFLYETTANQDLEILLPKGSNIERLSLNQLLPLAFEGGE